MQKRPWLPAELKALRELYPNHTAQFVANVLSRTSSQVYNKAFELGVEKSDAFWESDASGRMVKGKQDPRIIGTQFKKGSLSWNKGVKGVTGTQAGCRATQFKKGRQPQESRNYLPVGSLEVAPRNGSS